MDTGTQDVPQTILADLLALFGVLFDGPPDADTWRRLAATVLPPLAAAAGMPDPGFNRWTAENLAADYEMHCLIPGGPGDLYPPAGEGEDLWDERAQEVQRLASLLEVPWQPRTFRPGHAYPQAPTHLSVAFGLASILLEFPGDRPLAGRSVEAWGDYLRGRILEPTLERLSASLPATSPYRALARLALGFIRQVPPGPPAG